jgi:hypothetical protein
MNRRILPMAFAVAGLLVGDVTTSQAASREFCESYAHAAIIQVRDARMHARTCEPGLEHARWSDNWRVHYDWCLGVYPREAERERDIRTNHLRACAH